MARNLHSVMPEEIDTMGTRLLTLCFLTLSLSSAWAQTAGTTQTLTSGDVESGFLIAPDFKFTEVNGDFANLAGGYGGWVIDKRFLIGGGVYTLTNGGGTNDMTYGGGVFEYFVNQGSLVNVSVRGLVGGGSATVGRRLSFEPFEHERDDRGLDFGFGRLPGNGPGFPGNIDVVPILDRVGGFLDRNGLDFLDRDVSASSSFFVAEPEVNVNVNISERIRFSVGGSYRFIGGAGRLNERLDGFAATAALKFTFF